MIITLLLLIIIVIWLSLFLEYVDQSIPTRKLPALKRVAVIFPHPDDESLSCGGTVYHFATHGTHVDLLVFTKGERGVEGALLTPALKPIRTQELLRSASYLNVAKLFHYDMGDGELDHQKGDLTKIVNQQLSAMKPDLVITYDESGLYGHPDHIVVSEVVTDLIKTKFPAITLWYVSRPAKTYVKMKLPIHMAKDPDFISQRKTAAFKVYIGLFGVTAKIMSLESHLSQHFGFTKNRKHLPIWYWASTQLYEYFYVAHEGKQHVPDPPIR